jgi:hypothetical protein
MADRGGCLLSQECPFGVNTGVSSNSSGLPAVRQKTDATDEIFGDRLGSAMRHKLLLAQAHALQNLSI